VPSVQGGGYQAHQGVHLNIARLLKMSQTWTIKARGATLIHRDDNEPAVIHPNGDREWWRYGHKLRTVKSDGTIMLYWGRVLHCSDGPAIIRPDGTKEWYCKGARHRVSGPAITRPDGSEEWYHFGEPVNL